MAENTFILLDLPEENTTGEQWKKPVCNPFVSDMSPCHFNEYGRLSMSFQDVGKESLGILPMDFEKDALSFSNISFSANRELGFKSIFNISQNGRESLDSGRESLGILQINKLDDRLGNEDENIPEIMLSTIPENSEVFGNVLDTAFLFPSPRKTLFSSTSSQNSAFPSFNSGSLEEPSKIYSLSRIEPASSISSMLDFNSVPSELNKAKMMSPEAIEKRLRIHSTPGENEFHPSASKFFWSTGKKIKSKNLCRKSFHAENIEFDGEKENILHDSILIEGKHIAQKIADGSILNNDYGTSILDSTPQPSWPSDLEDSKTKEKDASPCESDVVFKTIDKMLPEPQENIELRLKTSRVNSTPSKSKDAKEILQNLSEILNSTHRSDQQRSQGQNLISSLAEILCEGTENHVQHLDDSGHSSFIEQNDMSDKYKYEDYEALDLSKKSVDSKDSKSYEYTSNVSVNKFPKNILARRFSHSLSLNSNIRKINLAEENKKRNYSASGLESSKNTTCNSNSSVKSNDSHGSGSYSITNINGKLKTKAVASGTKKGPLKAVIPVKDMKRNVSNFAQTPEKSQQPSSTSLQSKRTSTPINEPKLKPMAASTPTAEVAKDKEAEISKDNARSISKLSRVSFKKSSRNDKAPIIQSTSSKQPVKMRNNLTR
nr:uncharacterized protein LOC111512801 [Leptinotarsa decemlineata]XP_023024731.1 uncharacterized protein LOC111512801 [Leptinotarsa decemlineata]